MSGKVNIVVTDHEPDSKPRQPLTRAARASLIMTVADTTWRMLVPSVAWIAAGLYADLNWGTKPWLTLAGLIAGLATSVFLIKLQLRGIK